MVNCSITKIMEIDPKPDMAEVHPEVGDDEKGMDVDRKEGGEKGR